jgi:GH25 family lysozyme M1 (1,4-beta-N-acetylmuramidase)
VRHAIDISTAQKGIEWDLIEADAVWCKLSEGVTLDRNRTKFARAAAKNCRQPLGWYHFARVNNDPAIEAGVFLAQLPERHELRCVLDLEPDGTGDSWGPSKLTRRQVASWALRWVRTVEAATGSRVILYYPAKRSFVPLLLDSLPHNPRWPSWRPFRVGEVDKPPPFELLNPSSVLIRDATLVQYSSRATGTPGITGNCDRNYIFDAQGVAW